MGGYKIDKITIITKYQWSVMDVAGFITGLLTCFGVSLGLLLKIFSLTTFIMRNWKFLLRQQMEIRCTDISDTVEDKIRPKSILKVGRIFLKRGIHLKERNARWSTWKKNQLCHHKTQ